jgi:signal transduction histidine kinase
MLEQAETIVASWLGAGDASALPSRQDRHRGERALLISSVFAAISLCISGLLNPPHAGPALIVDLLLAGYVIASGVVIIFLRFSVSHWARTEAATLAAVVSRVQMRLGLKHAMDVVFDALVRALDAKGALVVVRETSNGRVSLWEGGRLAGPAAQPLRVIELDARSMEHYMFAPAAAAWFAVKRSPGAGQLDLVALDHDGLRIDEPQEFPEAFLASIGPFRQLMAIGFEIPGEFTGRLFLRDPRAGRNRERALAFGQRIVAQLCPVVHNVYLLHRLRSRSAANERARLAREMHDGILQSVLGVQIQLHALSIPAAKNSRALASELNRLGTILRDETVTLRDLMRGLTPLELPPEQLMATLSDTILRFQQETGITARFMTPFDRLDLPPKACREVTRIVEEALVNVRKHSGARNVLVQLTAEDGVCRLSIDDDGRGFPYEGTFSTDMPRAHRHPKIIQERVRLLGGEVNVESDPMQGARVEISFPLAIHATRG